MADTIRTLSALQTLLADNTTQEISPQDIRDMLVSLGPTHGSMHISTPAETTITTAGVYVKAAGTTTSIDLDNFSMPANNRLQNTAGFTRHACATVNLSITAAGNNKVLGFKVAIDGVVNDESEIIRKVATGTDRGSVTLGFGADLADDSFIELWVTNTTDTVNLTVNQMYFHVMGLIVS